ncbi:MAG: hypothetical protein REI94_09025 [Moraxellaceae bacterium]|nr:hypothetical protein [Moraxellaceae bacterium]
MRTLKISALTLVASMLLPMAVQAAPLYQYTYTSGIFGDPATTGPDFLGQRFTIDIWSPVAFGLGSVDTEGMRARGTAPGIQIDFPQPPPTTSCQPDPWFPEGGCTQQPDYPYATASQHLQVLELDGNGLPLAWDLALYGSWIEGWRWNESSFLSLISSYYSDSFFVEDIYGGTPVSSGLIARNLEDTGGSWRLTVSEVPAPSTALLAVGALLALRLVRRPAATQTKESA